MGRPRSDLCALIGIPEMNRAVFSSTGHHQAIPAPGDRGNATGVPLQDRPLTGPERLPEKQIARPVSSRKQHTVRRKGNTRNPVGVLGDRAFFLTVFGGHQPNYLGCPAEGNQSLIGGKIGSQHLVILISQSRQPCATGNIPEHHTTTFGSDASRGKQEPRIAREPQRFAVPFGKRQHPQQLPGRRTDKEHLLPTTNSQQVTVRRGIQPRHRRRSQAVRHHLQRQPGRHHRITLGCDNGPRIESQLCHRPGGHRLGPIPFDQPADNPGLDDRQHVVRNPIGIGRHDRL